MSVRRSLASLLRRLAARLDPVPPQPVVSFPQKTYMSAGTSGTYTFTFGDTN